MATLRRRHHSRPDEVRTIPGGQMHMVELGDSLASYTVFEPGWRWSTHVKPIAGTELCDFHHVGYTLSGRVVPLPVRARCWSRGPRETCWPAAVSTSRIAVGTS